MRTDRLTPLESFKLAAISVDEIPDMVVEQMFLNLEIQTAAIINEVIGILHKHRPKILAKYEKDLKNKD